jgi:hypothetical protein
LESLKLQYVSTKDALEAERSRRLQLEGQVADLKQRLQNLQLLREQQVAAAAAERAQWEAQVALGQQQRDAARQQLETLQQEYFSACEWVFLRWWCCCSLEAAGGPWWIVWQV